MRVSRDGGDPGRVHGLVTFGDVWFPSGTKPPAVLRLNFTAAPGETIALVGATHPGKSTALALLHRSFDPQSGRIEIDGRDIRTLNLTELRRNIGVVVQEGQLFERSVSRKLPM